jgi:ABC-type uncharacterized transport system permease subunit
MIAYVFLLIAALYWIAAISRLATSGKVNSRWDRTCSIFEKLSFTFFTLGILYYLWQLQIPGSTSQDQATDHPISWLLFAWSVSAANLVSELVYSNQFTAFFANLWVAVSLSFLPHSRSEGFNALFNNDVQWLSLYRLSFLLGYAFCMLALPLTIMYFWKTLRNRSLSSERKKENERALWRIDRMSYRMILLALPLLTLGIIIEALVLFEHHQLPDFAQIWNERKEVFLAIATWFICGIFLHSRIFFAWKNKRSALLYLGGLVVILVAHFSSLFF